MRILLLCASIFVFVQCESEPRRCSFFRKGFVCAENLRAYYECDGSNPFGEYNACKADEICSCGKNTKCPDNRPLCVKKPNFTDKEVPKDFEVSFHGQMSISSPGGLFIELIGGTVRQSMAPGKEMLAETTTFKKQNGDIIKKVVKITKRLQKDKVVQVSEVFNISTFYFLLVLRFAW